MKQLLCTIMMASLLALLVAQYDQKQIMSQQAHQLMARRQFNEAEQLFRQILHEYPNDLNSVLQLFQIYLQTAQTQKADTLLTAYRRVIPSSSYSEQRVLLYVHQGKPNEAMSLAQAYLVQSNHDQNKYRLLASYFEQRSFFEYSIDLYSQAREHYGDPLLFCLEIGSAAMRAGKTLEAAREYLKWLEQSPNNLYFVANQFKSLITSNPDLILQLESTALEKDIPQLWELYAISLVQIQRYTQALEVYKRLPQDRLLRFAEDQYASQNDEIAFMAFDYLYHLSTDPLQQSDLQLRKAQIRYRDNRIDESSAILDSLLSTAPTPQENRLARRSQTFFDARKLKTEILFGQAASKDSILQSLDALRIISSNAAQISEAAILKGRYLMMCSDFAEAESLISAINYESSNHERDFYLYLSHILQGNLSKADTLMNEYVIMYPESPWVNDAIYLMMLIYGISEAQRPTFIGAYQDFSLQNPVAVDSLLQIYEATENEDYLILAAEWAYQLGQIDRALSLLEMDYEDPLSSEYAQYLKLKFTTETRDKQELARQFLSQNPTSVFSPGFRAIFSGISPSVERF